eukprot:358975-Chlamydomonas_euryale.AAC.8
MDAGRGGGSGSTHKASGTNKWTQEGVEDLVARTRQVAQKIDKWLAGLFPSCCGAANHPSCHEAFCS